jgi:protocatechuate 3,4-dioxygenase beta subunit
MSNRREVLLSLGAGLAAMTGTAHLALPRVMREHHDIRRPGDGHGVGVPVDGLPEASSALRCTAGTLTPPQMEGPFYTPRAPHRRDIRDFGVAAQPLVVRGRVLDSRCQPFAGAILDFWQTGHDGVYDQHGYRYRGYQYTDSAGRFELVTVRPHAYTAMSSFRTPHIHVKVQGNRTALLTTQLYLPDARETNARDSMYDASLEIAYATSDGSAQHGSFDFVLASV